VGTLPGAAAEAGAEETIHPGSPAGPPPAAGQHFQQPLSPPASATAWRRSASSASLPGASASAPGSPACWARQQQQQQQAPAPAGPHGAGAEAGAAAAGKEEEEKEAAAAATGLEAALQLAALSDEHLDVLEGPAAVRGAGEAGPPKAGSAAEAPPFSADAAMRALGLSPHLRARCCGTAFHDQELFLWCVGGCRRAPPCVLNANMHWLAGTHIRRPISHWPMDAPTCGIAPHSVRNRPPAGLPPGRPQPDA
jgi:hypothetical protein